MPEAQGQIKKPTSIQNLGRNDDFVLEKSIFSNVFEKDIQRVYIYKKAERLAKAIHMVAPAFAASPALKNRTDTIALALIDAAILPPLLARDALSRELLALSSVLSIARINGTLSAMNADLIAREAQLFLQEIAAYEAPRVFLEEVPTLASLSNQQPREVRSAPKPSQVHKGHLKGQIKDIPQKDSRRSAILAVIRGKGTVYIKDIAKVVRGVSEKTVQRELAALVAEGVVTRKGERRWTLYSLA